MPYPQAAVERAVKVHEVLMQALNGGRDLRPHPLRARRERLEALIEGQQCVLPARRLPAHGLEAWEEVLRRGYEGLVAKDESSTYLGGRTRLWLKVKRRATGNENRTRAHRLRVAGVPRWPLASDRRRS